MAELLSRKIERVPFLRQTRKHIPTKIFLLRKQVKQRPICYVDMLVPIPTLARRLCRCPEIDWFRQSLWAGLLSPGSVIKIVKNEETGRTKLMETGEALKEQGLTKARMTC